MIEFKGTYSPQKNQDKIAVLVQFDGVLLHVWHLAEPFYRLLSSDVFQLPWSLSKGQRCIKLPSGGKIETDDQDALTLLRSKCLSLLGGAYSNHFIQNRLFILFGAVLTILGIWSIFYFSHLL